MTIRLMLPYRLARLGLGLLPALALATACNNDDAPSGDGGTGGTGPMSTGISISGTTTSGAVDSTGVVDGTTLGSTGGTGGTTCETIICGSECCAEGEECVSDTCLPPCDSGIRCGDDQSICCDDGQVCLNPNCVTPGDPCLDSYDCPEGEFCENTLGETGLCLPQQDPVDCELQPVFDMIEPQLEWSWEDREVITIPAVADVDGDGLPEVVINTFNEPGGGQLAGTIHVFDGQTGAEQFAIANDPMNDEYGSYSRTSVAIGDVDGNGLPDIVYAGRPASPGGGFHTDSSIIHAINGLGQHLWSSHDAAMNDYYFYIRQGAIALANFDGDDASEVVLGAGVIDNDGLVVFDITENPNLTGFGPGTLGAGATYGSNSNQIGGWGGLSAIADLTGDGYPEIISGRDAWLVDWQDPGVGNPTVDLTALWADDPARTDGFPAIADIDQDGDPEVILVSEGTVRILDGATGQLWCGRDDDGDGSDCAGMAALRTQPLDIPDPSMSIYNRGGPPTVADFDGDGRPEVGVAGASLYLVLDFNRAGEDVQVAPGYPAPGDGDIFIRWESATQDMSSNATGSSVHDFQGDGAAEVLYNDECHMRIYDGPTGMVLYEVENPSATIREYPVVVDVDGDNNSELIVVANDVNAVSDCEPTNPGYVGRRGVFVYGDTNDQWVRTRAVWTQHAYHVTNATSTGLTPPMELNNWDNPDLNNYRQNVQGAGVFNAPDLDLDLSVGTSTCLDEQFEIVATVRNTGSTGVPAGIVVSLYEGTDNTGNLISTQTTLDPLLPGASVDLLWLVPAPGGVPLQFYAEVDLPDDLIAECNEDNNTGVTMSVACPDQG